MTQDYYDLEMLAHCYLGELGRPMYRGLDKEQDEIYAALRAGDAPRLKAAINAAGWGMNALDKAFECDSAAVETQNWDFLVVTRH